MKFYIVITNMSGEEITSSVQIDGAAMPRLLMQLEHDIRVRKVTYKPVNECKLTKERLDEICEKYLAQEQT